MENSARFGRSSVRRQFQPKCGQKLDSERTYPKRDYDLFYHAAGSSGVSFRFFHALRLRKNGMNFVSGLGQAQRADAVPDWGISTISGSIDIGRYRPSLSEEAEMRR
jgi:hypothetical protein